jgi:Fic family protein
MYVRREAVLSSQIEGTQSTLSELLEFENAEAPGAPVDDVREVSRYVSALRFIIDSMRSGTPLSLRLIRDTHRVLMTSGRGSAQDPGEFRRSQNWIGGTRPGTARFVPPPPHELPRILGELERFIVEGNESPIIKAGMAHAQFETIHPFLDGNGRLGRLLITAILCDQRALHEPFLYLSLDFKQHRNDYYTALQRVRTHGDWEGWMVYYLDGIDWTARQAIATTTDLIELFARDTEAVRTSSLRRSALKVFAFVEQKVIVSIRRTAEATGLSVPTVTAALNGLIELGIAREVTDKRHGRLFAYARQLEILNREDEVERNVEPTREEVWRRGFDEGAPPQS